MAIREDDTIGISARSLGKVNVQIIMEEMNGGGHLTNAATRLEGKSIDEAYNELKEAIDAFIKNRSE